MAVLLPPDDTSGLMPNLPGAGIVPPAPAQYAFAQPPPAAPPAPEKTRYSILSRLLGDAHADQVASKQALVNFYAQNIHSAYNDPSNTTPDEVLTHWGQEMGKLLGNPTAAKAIKADIDRHIASREAGKKLPYVNQTQNQGQQNLGTPVTPGAPSPAPAGPPPAARPSAFAQPLMGSAVDNLPWSPQNVARNAPQQGLPAPPVPFGDGGQAGAPAPLANEPAPTAIAARAGGMGFGTTPQPAPAPSMSQTGLSPTRMSPSDIAVRKAQAEIAGSRVLAQYAPEQVAMGMYRLKAMGIDPSVLTPTQISEFFSTGKVPAPESIKAQEGEIIRLGNGKIIYGYPKPISTAAGGMTTIPGLPGGAVPGVPYDPNNPMQNTPAGASGAGPSGVAAPGTVIKGGPLLSRAQQSANAMWERTHPGGPIDPKDYAQALSEFTEASMSASAKKLRDAQIANVTEMRAMRGLEEQKLNQTIREFNATKGPEAIDSLADQVYANPDFYAKLTGDTANLVAQRFQAKYNLPPPRPAPADLKNKEEASLISLNHVVALKELLKNPVIQKRMGLWNGNIGTLEQYIGTTAGLSPADARAIQDFRTRTTYLFGQEGKAVFGGRPPQRLMEDLKKSSPRMTMGLPLFQGAMDAVQGMGELNIQAADDYRYNVRPGGVRGTGGGGTAAPRSAAPPATVRKTRADAMNNPPEKIYTWTNSKGVTVSGGIAKADEAEFLSHHPEAKAQ